MNRSTRMFCLFVLLWFLLFSACSDVITTSGSVDEGTVECKTIGSNFSREFMRCVDKDAGTVCYVYQGSHGGGVSCIDLVLRRAVP